MADGKRVNRRKLLLLTLAGVGTSTAALIKKTPASVRAVLRDGALRRLAELGAR